jgi:hypothetical protein
MALFSLISGSMDLRQHRHPIFADNWNLADEGPQFAQTLATRAFTTTAVPCGLIIAKPARNKAYATSTPNTIEPTDTAINITKFIRSVISTAQPHSFRNIELPPLWLRCKPNSCAAAKMLIQILAEVPHFIASKSVNQWDT